MDDLPTLEQRMDDVRAVMEAVGSRRAALIGASEGGPMAALFAATYPERTSSLVMYGAYARGMAEGDYPWAATRWTSTPAEFEATAGLAVESWGEPVELLANLGSEHGDGRAAPRLVRPLPAHVGESGRGDGLRAHEPRRRHPSHPADHPRSDAGPPPCGRHAHRSGGKPRAICERVHGLGIQVRAGLHAGECELRNGDVTGIAVHTAARVSSEADAGEVLVSSTVKDLAAGSGIEFRDRGTHSLKGIPGEWRLSAVTE